MDSSLTRWLFTTNHKDIGILYLVTSLYFLILGGALAILMRIQLMLPNNQFLSAGPFNQAVTVHGLIMVLWFLSPLAFAFANYIVPLQIGARDLAFPRLNAMSYWFYLFGGLLAAVGFFTPGGAIDTGWTVYAPLNTLNYSRQLGVTLGGAGLLMLIASVTMGTVNFLVTIFRLRAKGMSLFKMPMYSWGILLTVFMMLLAFPSILAGVIMLVADRLLGTLYFLSNEGGAILWDHLFWFFGHPEVYILLMPGLMAIAEIFPVFARRPLYGKRILIFAAIIGSAMSFIVWAHHMFVTGIDPGFRKFMTITTEAISIPFGIITLCLILTLFRASIRFKTPMLFALGSLALFIVGGITGVFNSSVALDYNLRGTYWIVAHFHYTLVGGATGGLIAALYYWWPKMTGRMYSERLGKLHFTIYMIGFNLLYFPMHLLVDMPRRVAVYSEEGSLWLNNYLSTIGSFIFAISWIIFFLILLKSLRNGKRAESNPWGSWSLEWMVPSPPPYHNFDVNPEVESDGTIKVINANGGSVESETHNVHLSKGPLMVALGTFLALLGVSLSIFILLIGSIIFAIALFGWAKENILGRFVIREPEVGERWPFSSICNMKLGVWFFLFGEVVFFSSILGGYLFIRANSTSWPILGEVFDLKLASINTFLLITSSLTAMMALNFIRKGEQRGLKLGLLLTFALGLLFLINKGIEWEELFKHGFTPSSSLPATIFYTTTGIHGAHVLAGLIVLLYLLVRAYKGGFSRENYDSVEYFDMYWNFVDVVWLFIFPLLYLI
ncbi:MAG: cbb3-type cytochrome c oxidase subunit I [Nitrososphaerales archaeon]